MSTTISAVIINLLVTFLPYFGIDTNSEQLNTTIQTLVALGTGIWIWYQRLTLKKVKGNEKTDVSVLGIKKD